MAKSTQTSLTSKTANKSAARTNLNTPAPATKTRKAAKSAAPASPTASSKRAASAKSQVTPKMQEPQTPRHAANPAEREQMIQTAAYHLAERDGFPAGREHDYWLQAEAQIDQLLRPSSSRETDQH